MIIFVEWKLAHMIWPTNTMRELSPHHTIVKWARDSWKQIITASFHLVKAISQEDNRVSHPITQPQIVVDMHFLRQLDKDSQRLLDHPKASHLDTHPDYSSHNHNPTQQLLSGKQDNYFKSSQDSWLWPYINSKKIIIHKVRASHPITKIKLWF